MDMMLTAETTHVTGLIQNQRAGPWKLLRILIVEDTDEGILIREAHMN